jgi:NADH-quinone oxidoreductase subunit J
MATIWLLGLTFVLILAVALAKDLLKAAVALAAASVFLSLVLFHHGAWVAAVFELSVCAGLITVLFVSTISLTKDSDQNEESKVSGYMLPAFLLFFIGIDFYALKWINRYIPTPSDTAEAILKAADKTSGFSSIFWSERTTDILGQSALILAGVFAILALFKRTAKHHSHEGEKHV